MRTLTLLCVTALVGVAFATTAAADTPRPEVVREAGVVLPGDDCKACVGAFVHLAQRPPPNCADCDSYGFEADAGASRAGAEASALGCRGGFFYFCFLNVYGAARPVIGDSTAATLTLCSQGQCVAGLP